MSPAYHISSRKGCIVHSRSILIMLLPIVVVMVTGCSATKANEEHSPSVAKDELVVYVFSATGELRNRYEVVSSGYTLDNTRKDWTDARGTSHWITNNDGTQLEFTDKPIPEYEALYRERYGDLLAEEPLSQ